MTMIVIVPKPLIIATAAIAGLSGNLYDKYAHKAANAAVTISTWRILNWSLFR
jgi:hypothetical protein